MDVIHISQKDFDALQYKHRFTDAQGTHPEFKGRWAAFLPGHGTTLSIEGVHFVIDGGETT
jgi:hypothetical protein